MRKLLAVLLLAIMCLSLSACGEVHPIVGTWEPEVTADGENVPDGDHFTQMIFDKDGKCTYVYNVSGSEISRTDVKYTVTDRQLTMLVESRELVCDYEIDGDRMTLTYNGVTQVLERIEY